MTDFTLAASRRAVIMGLAGTAAFAGTIGATIASPAEAATIPGEPTPEGNRLYDEAFGHGFKEGGEIALLHTARAWIDRWRAAGGDFGLLRRGDGGRGRLLVGYCEPHIWQPIDNPRDEASPLDPHVCLTEEEHQSGAIRVLQGLLVLVPGLEGAVREIVGVQLLAAPEREA